MIIYYVLTVLSLSTVEISGESCHCSLFASWTDRRRALLPQLINTRPDKRDKRTSVIKHVNM